MEFSGRVVEMRVSGCPLSMRFVLNCEIAVLSAVSKELVQGSLNGLLWMKPFFTLCGWQLKKCMY